MNNQHRDTAAKPTPAPTGTRDAVETAIGLRKQARQGTWESNISKVPNRVTRWSNPPDRERKSAHSL